MANRSPTATSLTINRVPLHSQLAQSLREMIVETRLAPGERVDEKALSESFGVSRTPLREALKVLASEGLVELLPNRSARVTAITRKGVQDLFEVISWLDLSGAQIAATKVTDVDIRRLQEIQLRMRRYYAAGDRVEYFRLNRKFHSGIIDIAGNSVLSTVYAGLMAQAQRARYVAIQSEAHWARGVDEHARILAALADRDAAEAGRLLFEHVRETGRRVAEGLEDG